MPVWPLPLPVDSDGQVMAQPSVDVRRDAKNVQKVQNMGGVFAKYSVQAVAWLFSKKSGLFFE